MISRIPHGIVGKGVPFLAVFVCTDGRIPCWHAIYAFTGISCSITLTDQV